jgi:hypothetical protein
MFLSVILVLSVVPAHLSGVPALKSGADSVPNRPETPRTSQ